MLISRSLSCLLGLLSMSLLPGGFCITKQRRNEESGFGNLFDALSDMADRAKSTFSAALLPYQTSERNTKKKLMERSFDVASSSKENGDPSSFRMPSDRDMVAFTKPIVKQTFKREASQGYLYNVPSNPLELPTEKHSNSESRNGRTNSIQDQLNLISFSDNLENGPDTQFNPVTQRIPGRLRPSTQLAQETAPRIVETFEDVLQGSLSEDNFNIDTVSPRSFQVGPDEANVINVSPVTINSTPGNFRIIQPIKIVQNKRRPQFQKPRTPKQSGGSLTFQDNPLSAVLGRQVAGSPIDGFPNGLPSNTPLGVRIVLENMIGPDGEINMPAIPGEAGTDYPVYTSVPETGFSCSAQDQPGIYTDTGADCQSFYMCEESGESTGFLCPNGTIFNQQYFICDWWYNVDCADQPNFYSLNSALNDPSFEGRKGCKTLFCITD